MPADPFREAADQIDGEKPSDQLVRASLLAASEKFYPEAAAEASGSETVKIRGREYAVNHPRVSAHRSMMRLLDDESAARDQLGQARSRTLLWFDSALTRALDQVADVTAERDALAAKVDQFRAWLVAEIAATDRLSDGSGGDAQVAFDHWSGTLALALGRLDEITGKGELP